MIVLTIIIAMWYSLNIIFFMNYDKGGKYIEIANEIFWLGFIFFSIFYQVFKMNM